MKIVGATGLGSLWALKSQVVTGITRKNAIIEYLDYQIPVTLPNKTKGKWRYA